MVELITLLEQHLDRQPLTVVTQATTWWETVLAHVKQQECGLGVHLPVNVRMLLFNFEHEVAKVCLHNLLGLGTRARKLDVSEHLLC